MTVTVENHPNYIDVVEIYSQMAVRCLFLLNQNLHFYNLKCALHKHSNQLFIVYEI